mgnify:CR=1 FL=1
MHPHPGRILTTHVGSLPRPPALVDKLRQKHAGEPVDDEGGAEIAAVEGRAVAEGPPIPVVVEPDAFPTVRITAPLAEVEVQPDATVRVDWQASWRATRPYLVASPASDPDRSIHQQPERQAARSRSFAGEA